MKHNLATLSFAEIGATGQILSLWRPEQGLGYVAGCAEGRRRADEAVRAMVESDNPTLLGHIVAQIVQCNDAVSGLEIGFFARIATLAIEGELHGRATIAASPSPRPVLRLVEAPQS